MKKDSIFLSTDDYRVFLKKALEANRGQGEKVNLSEFSRKVGFRSRSYLSEVLSGKKGLTRSSLELVKKQIPVPKNYKELFETLVLLNEEKLRAPGVSTAQLQKKLVGQRRDCFPLSQEIPEKSDEAVRELAQHRNFFRIYAALGRPREGASIHEIVEKTGLSSREVSESLEVLIRAGAAQKIGEQYIANESAMDLFGLTARSGLDRLVRETCSEIGARAPELIDDSSNLIFYSAMSVSKAKRLAFRKRLQEAIYEVMDEFQDDGGDSVQQVFFSMFK